MTTKTFLEKSFIRIDNLCNKIHEVIIYPPHNMSVSNNLIDEALIIRFDLLAKMQVIKYTLRRERTKCRLLYNAVGELIIDIHNVIRIFPGDSKLEGVYHQLIIIKASIKRLIHVLLLKKLSTIEIEEEKVCL